MANDNNQTTSEDIIEQDLVQENTKPIRYGLGVAYVRFAHYIGSDQTHRIIFPYPKLETKHFLLDDDGSILRLFQNETFKVDVTASGRLPVYAGEVGEEEEKGIEFLRPTEKTRLRAGLNDLNVVMMGGVEFISDPNKYLNIEIPIYWGRVVGESKKVGFVFSPKLELKILKDGYKDHKLNLFINHLYAAKEYNRYYYGIEKQYINSLHPKEYKPSGGLVYQRYGFSYEYSISDDDKVGVFISRYDMSNSVVKGSSLVANEHSSSFLMFFSTFF